MRFRYALSATLLFISLGGLLACSKQHDGREIVGEQSSTLPLLRDTGITFGGNYPQGINDDCRAKLLDESRHNENPIAGDIREQQDCAQGTDAFESQLPTLFIKIDKDGHTLPDNAEQWDCVADKISGLMWEVKRENDGKIGERHLHDADDRFTWYNSDEKTNGGDIGDWNRENRHCFAYTENQPKTYCNIEQFASRVNKQGLCGYHDWRLPTRPELTTLVHFGRTEPAINTAYFPNTQSDFFWSASAVPERHREAWAISFQFGFSTPLLRTDSRHTRLVRKLEEKDPANNRSKEQ